MFKGFTYAGIFFIVILILCIPLWAGQTGKIAGKVVDAKTGDPLPGANVFLEGTNMGAATDMDGEYFILNVPPGTYTVVASMIGYSKGKVVNVKVAIDLTSRVDFKLNEEAVEMNEVVVTASIPIVQKDLTSTVEIVRSEDIKEMAVQEFKDILQLQAGITTGEDGAIHIRGGRSSEIVYLVDGVSVTNPYDGSLSVELENDAIEQLQVISGSFNAEYGQALSGVVEVVSKEGTKDFHGGVSFYSGDYISLKNDHLKNVHHFDDDNIFNNINHVSPTDIFNLQGNLSGPIPFTGGKVTFFTFARYLKNDGWLYGTRVFNPSDSSFIPADLSRQS